MDGKFDPTSSVNISSPELTVGLVLMHVSTMKNTYPNVLDIRIFSDDLNERVVRHQRPQPISKACVFHVCDVTILKFHFINFVCDFTFFNCHKY